MPLASRTIPNPSNEANHPTSPPRKTHSTRFWITIISLCLLAFVSALDVMIITTALPTIVQDVGGSTQYTWIANSFVFASSVVQPLVGQLANTLGRKTPILGSIIFFTVGSTIAGAAYNSAMIIAGRPTQGLGAGGIYVLIDIVYCDLVPLRNRGTYLRIVNSWAGIAAALGPVLGGILGERNWRWIFFMNLPIYALPLITIFSFIDPKSGSGIASIRNLDYFGNFIFIPSMVAFIFALVTGGSEYPWSSWRIILPLVLGVIGWIGFHIQQHYFASNPSIPTRLFSNRTSAAAYALAFLGSLLLQKAGLFLPVYFQVVLTTTVFDSGIYFLPLAIGTLFSAAITGILLTKTGAYRPLHAAAFALSILAYSLFTLLNRNTPKVTWAFFELIIAGGLGITISVILPAILAALPESDVASAIAAFSFIKTFGFIWGVTIPSVIFNAVFNDNLSLTSSLDLRKHQARSVSETLDPDVWDQVVQVYIVSRVSVVALLLVGAERGLELSTELKTEYGLNEEKGSDEAHNTKENPGP
ncbi:major facilitator superfamily domain-containing protein [Daldinia decipiens]|uniref:major facilitator superfamily domain-containing protein n=1 Tax=Daldinia decipiens TaxID=326647 RepID=UPI0020C2EB80|nr:major facilitator superfamily domain-containing protein [Daldinia decipiens]KAI1654944.1 major facilitator superfamily domain-containing protein [Daldinia decipiens]